MAVKRGKTSEKDDGRKTTTRKSSGSTKKSAPESDSSVIGAAITNSTTSSETCSRPNESSSSKVVTGVTGIDDIMNILVNIQKEQRSQREDVRTLRTSVDELYNYTDDNYADYFDVENTRVNETEIDTNKNIGSSDGNQNESEEPPTKKAKSDNVFAIAAKNFKVNETVDDKVGDELATMINSLFREGISDEKFQDLLKNVNRPENCNALTKTRVNQLIWDLLSPSTRSYDSCLQQHQNSVIKAACCVVTILDTLDKIKRNEENSDDIQKCIEYGLDAVGLMAQYNKLTNIKRKENHRSDLSHEYHHLSSSSVPYTDFLYGDDVPKSVKEIQDINRVGKRIVRPYGTNYRGRYMRGRSTVRGNSFGGRGRGFIPRGRGTSNSYQSGPSKNLKTSLGNQKKST